MGLMRARWIQQMAMILRGRLSLEEAVLHKRQAPKIPKVPSLDNVRTLADELCEAANSGTPEQLPVEMAYSLYHAGQDWLRCGDPSHVAHFYKCFMPLFQCWVGLGRENKQKLTQFVVSEGKENAFVQPIIVNAVVKTCN